ncbi:hypothetical protein O0544_22315 [Edwardsiella anguillarum]|nr:hypothetical protein [Edwardsiella anguillarum]
MNPIEIAELSQIDDDAYAQLTTLIINTWEYDDWLEDEQVSPMAEYFLNDIILSSQKMYVALRAADHRYYYRRPIARLSL